ncbi:MAG: energy transducer TonB [Methylacidiphilales bacterium]|nr:energy transducer TonB [Candidatus Methylacidiphilales bacterium]
MANSSPEHPAVSASDPVTQTLALLQPWIDYVPRKQRRLGLFIFLALLVHLATFFFIRIDTTRAELRHQTRTHVSVEEPQAVSADGGSDNAFWDQLTDPRLFLLPLNPLAGLASDQPPLDLETNLGSHQLPPAALPEEYRAARPIATPLVEQVKETMSPPRQLFSYDETPPAIATQTTWQWDDALAARQPTGLPELPSPVSDTDLSPTVLNVAVNPNGSVEHVLVEQSCGDLGATTAKDLDHQAVLAANKIHFSPTNQPGLLWGRITVFWRYSAKPSEEVVPTPPTSQ